MEPITHREAAALAAELHQIDPEELEGYFAFPVTGGWEVEFFYLDGTSRTFTVMLKSQMN